jgi:uncharacterized protein (DUF1330 family)
MPAYLIVYRETPIRDQAEMDEYHRQTRQMSGDFKLTPLVAYGAVQALEGDAPDAVIMLQFPTVEDARAWYDDPAYQAALPHRLKSADFRTIIVEGLSPPPA